MLFRSNSKNNKISSVFNDLYKIKKKESEKNLSVHSKEIQRNSFLSSVSKNTSKRESSIRYTINNKPKTYIFTGKTKMIKGELYHEKKEERSVTINGQTKKRDVYVYVQKQDHPGSRLSRPVSSNIRTQRTNLRPASFVNARNYNERPVSSNVNTYRRNFK